MYWYRFDKHHKKRDALPHLHNSQDDNPYSIEAIIWRSQMLVDICLPDEVSIDEEGARLIISAHRRLYVAVAVWLDHLTLKNELQEKAISEYALYQPFAELEHAFLDLATGVHPRYASHHNFPSPAVMWEDMRIIECQNTLFETGALTGSSLSPKGKVAITQNRLGHLKACDEDVIEKTLQWVERKEKPQEGYGFLEWEQNPKFFLIQVAAMIASTDPTFDSTYWKPFKRAYSFWNRKIRECEHIQSVGLLSDGSVFIAGKGRKIPKKTKGFGKKVM